VSGDRKSARRCSEESLFFGLDNGVHFIALDAAIQALTRQDTQLRLRHVQPTAVLGRVMNLQTLRQGEGRDRIKRFVQTTDGVGVEIVHHQDDYRNFGIHRHQQVLNEACPIDPRALLRHLHSPLARQRLHRHEDIGRPTAFVFAVLFGHLPRSGRQRRAHLSDQLFARFIHAHQRTLRIVGAMVHLQDVFHRRHVFRRGSFRQTPAFLQPRLEVVFFSVCRTVSWAIASTWPKATRRSASNRKVQRARPSGGAPQAIATR
jgi:hypothetical protein